MSLAAQCFVHSRSSHTAFGALTIPRPPSMSPILQRELLSSLACNIGFQQLELTCHSQAQAYPIVIPYHFDPVLIPAVPVPAAQVALYHTALGEALVPPVGHQLSLKYSLTQEGWEVSLREEGHQIVDATCVFTPNTMPPMNQCGISTLRCFFRRPAHVLLMLPPLLSWHHGMHRPCHLPMPPPTPLLCCPHAPHAIPDHPCTCAPPVPPPWYTPTPLLQARIVQNAAKKETEAVASGLGRMLDRVRQGKVSGHKLFQRATRSNTVGFRLAHSMSIMLNEQDPFNTQSALMNRDSWQQ